MIFFTNALSQMASRKLGIIKNMDADLQHRIITTGSSRLHVVEKGESHAETIVFLHGWPQDWTAWHKVMQAMPAQVHAVAVDLPGIGGSSATSGEKEAMAQSIHEAIVEMGLRNYILVGHDIGAMVAFAYLRQFANELRGVVLMDAAVPGVEPWEKVVTNPHIWHFAFHAIPALPETLVTGKQQEYFDFFFDALTKDNSAISNETRQHYASAYGPAALTAGFGWYRAFETDAKANQQAATAITTPLLYLRGEMEGGTMEEYKKGLEKAGLQHVTTARIAGSAHFTPEENPEAVWHEINTFVASLPKLR